MARDAVTILDADADGVAVGAGTTINTTNGASIAVGSDTDNLLVVVTNTATTPDHDVTVQSGPDDVTAPRSSLGDVTINAATAAGVAFRVESARHVQTDGKIYLDFESGMAGKVFAYRLAED